MTKLDAVKIAPAFRGLTGAATVKFTEGAADGTKVTGETIEEIYENLKTVKADKIYVDGVGSFEAVASEKTGRCAKKIAIVTGSAQGFGLPEAPVAGGREGIWVPGQTGAHGHWRG